MEVKIWMLSGERGRREPNKHTDLRYGRSGRWYFDLLQTYHYAAETISHHWNEVWWTFCGLPKCYFRASKVQLAPQEDGETVDTFSTALCAVAKYCNYGTLKDEMIQDRIVVGLQDQRLSEKLQLDPQLLSLTKVKGTTKWSCEETTSSFEKWLQRCWRLKEKHWCGQSIGKEHSQTQRNTQAKL